MKILGIESSCDDTSVAIVSSDKKIYSNERVSQDNVHQLYKGVVPELAARNHLFQIEKITENAFNNSKLTLDDIDGVAATAGPGLVGGLLVGLSFAKTIAQVKKLPFYAINHLEGHALTPRLTDSVEFPYLLLLVSGGHSNFYYIKDINQYYYLGGTLDDAVGETFDKIGKVLDLNFPGGPEIEKKAKNGDERAFKFPRPLLDNDKTNLNLSFSGLKSHIVGFVNSNWNKTANPCFKEDVAASFQKTVCDILVNKLGKAIDFCDNRFPSYNNVVVSGGVASNKYLRKNFENIILNKNKKPFIPPAKLCTDNGAMIAWAGLEKQNFGVSSSLNFKALPRWPLHKESIYE